MSVRILLFALAMFTLVTLPFHPALAAEAAVKDEGIIGTILEVEGKATITYVGRKPVAAAENSSVHMNDLIETGVNSRVFILLIDNTQWTLSENTKFTVDEYVYDPDNSAGNKGSYSILTGAFRYVSGLVAKKPNPDVQIETPAGSIGIRGTDITGGEIDGEYGIAVDEGAVDVTTDKGKVRVNRGEGTLVKGRKFAPGRATQWKKEHREKLRQRVALKRKELVQQRMEKMQERHKLMRERFKQYLQYRKGNKLQKFQQLQQRREGQRLQPGLRRRYNQ